MNQKVSDDEYAKIIAVDPLADAERMTGQSYKTDESTSLLGLMLALQNSAKQNAAAEANDDYRYSMDFADAERIALDEGFKEALRVPFKGKPWNKEDPEVDETLLIMWHDDGLLLVIDSHHTHLNSGKVYFNWKATDQSRAFFRQSSGGCEEVNGELVHVGDRDVRDGLRYICRELRRTGELLPVWIKPGWLWLLHYMDTKEEGYDYKAINAERYAALPEYVRNAMKWEG